MAVYRTFDCFLFHFIIFSTSSRPTFQATRAIDLGLNQLSVPDNWDLSSIFPSIVNKTEKTAVWELSANTGILYAFLKTDGAKPGHIYRITGPSCWETTDCGEFPTQRIAIESNDCVFVVSQ